MRSLCLFFMIGTLPCLLATCKSIATRSPISETKSVGENCYYNGFTTCLSPGPNALVCNTNHKVVSCEQCISDWDSIPLEHRNANPKDANGFYHDYATGCQAPPAVTSTAPVAPPSNPTPYQGGDTMIFGYNIHDANQHHYYAGLDRGRYQEGGKAAYVLHRAFAENYLDGVNRAISQASAKGDRLIVRLDYADGLSVPVDDHGRSVYFAALDNLLANPGIAYVQAGNEPNLDYECRDNVEYCKAHHYRQVLARYLNHSKFISAPWGPGEFKALVKPWTWAVEALSGLCPRNIGIHAYPATGDHGRAWTTANQLIAMNIKYIKAAGCHSSNVFITEMNGNQFGDRGEWDAAIKAARSAINWVNARSDSPKIRAALLFTLGDPNKPDHEDDMTRFYLSKHGREGAIDTAKYCGSWGHMPNECKDETLAQALEKAWQECILNIRPADGFSFCPH